MAARADSLPMFRPRAFLRLLAPEPGRLEFAARLALICALTVLVAQIYQTPDAALTAYVAFFLNREDRTTSLILTVALTLVLSFVVALVLLIARVVTDDMVWRVASIAAISFVFLFLASASKLKPVAGTVALIIGYALDELGLVQIGELATRGLLYAWLLVGIPAAVSIVVNLLLAPSPRRLAEREIARRLELAAALLRSPSEPIRAEFRTCLDAGLSSIVGLVDRVRMERSAPADDIAALHQAVRSLSLLLAAIDVSDRCDAYTLPETVRREIAETLVQMAAIFRSGGYPRGARLPEWAPVSNPEAQALYGKIEEAIAGFAQPGTPSAQTGEKVGEASQGFFANDAFRNPIHVRYALKTTGAAMFCYVLYSLLDWPGIHTCFLTCYIVAQATVAESVEKLVLRIAGCVVGAIGGLACIIYLVPMLTSIEGLMATVFFGALVSAYVAAGSERISYAGFQMAFAFFLCVVQGVGPAFDLTVARDRIIGILIGNLVVYLVFTRLWPAGVAERVDPALDGAVAAVRAVSLSADSDAQRSLAISALERVNAVRTDIDLARYEPSPLRPDDAWLSRRQQIVDALGALTKYLQLDSAGSAQAHRIAARLDSATSRKTAPDAVASSPDAPDFAGMADAKLRQIEDFYRYASTGFPHALA